MTRYKKEGIKKVEVKILDNKWALCFYKGDPNYVIKKIIELLKLDDISTFDTVYYYGIKNKKTFCEINFVEEEYIGGYIR